MRQATWICGLLLVFSQSARADIVITANPNPFEPLASSLLNNVWDYELTIQGFSTTPGQNIAVYAFDVVLPVQATAIVATINNSASAGGWQNFIEKNVNTTTIGGGLQQVRFTGGPNTVGPIASPYNVLLPTTASTIGTITFSVARPPNGAPDLSTQFTVREASVAGLLGFTPNTGDGVGFYQDNSDPNDAALTNVSNVASSLEPSGLIRPFTVSAVPEPSSIMLVGLAAGGLSLRRRRSRAA